MPDSAPQEDLIEQALREALEGSKPAARLFFKTFLASSLFVPERFQSCRLSDMAEYPNDFLNILAVKDGARAVVPAFSRLEYILEWCGNEMTSREVTGAELLKLVPADWWLVMNPGREVEKEISPWEIDQLRAGAEGIEAVVEEIFAGEPTETVEIGPAAEHEYQGLKAALQAAFEQMPEIRSLYLLKEIGKDLEEQTVQQALIGVEAPQADPDQIEALRIKIKDAAAPCQIGGDAVKVWVGSTLEGSLALGVFKNAEPLFSRKDALGLWGRVRKAFARPK
jgi:hypothetical protein